MQFIGIVTFCPKTDVLYYIIIFTLHYLLEATAHSLEYDFEGSAAPTDISSTLGSTIAPSTTHFKHGSKSLKWQWVRGSSKLNWDLSTKTIEFARYAGIKMWIYNSNPVARECLSVCIQEKKSSPSQTKASCFPMSLNFEGWRAVWVIYDEFRGCLTSSLTAYSPSRDYNGWSINNFSFTAPSGSSGGTLYIDLLRFLPTVSRQTRDSVVPPLWYKTTSNTKKCTNCDKINAGFSEADALAVYNRKKISNHIFRWSLVSGQAVADTVATAELADIRENITNRLMNWYADESTTFTTVPLPSTIPNTFLMQRWHSLLGNIDRAHREFKKFTTGAKLTRGLFVSNSKYGASQDNRFSSVFFKVLHPLSLEYYIKSRSIEVDHTACEFAKIYTCTVGRRPSNNDVKAITGRDKALKKLFKSNYSPSSSIASSPHLPTCLGVSQACLDYVKATIDTVNVERKNKIIKLFDYVKAQGFTKGSTLGSNDYVALEISGYFHSAFLMRDVLKAEGKLNDVIITMKWYSSFGEIYQRPFEYAGTSADTARTKMLFRLLTILAMPEDNDNQKKEKIRDMEAFKRWLDNALGINEALAGMIKPDFTSFHHQAFYGSAYTSEGLQTAALISYLLQGTSYDLGNTTRVNLVNALKVLRIAAVRYSTPSSIGGRFPSYTRAALADLVPGYAYIAANLTGGVMTLNRDLAEVRMFRRLYQHTAGTCTGTLNSRLCKGNVNRIYYLNTLGSLEIMKKVESLASAEIPHWKNKAEPSPEGHWCKQFAALSIHRRSDWVVTVKGFDKYVWDFEDSASENRYGMYASHGAMLIANSESALSSKDVDSGWDWRKIPGTTVINVDFPHMLIPSHRYYGTSVNSMAGGVELKGSTSKQIGVFGMAFVQPTYKTPSYFSGVNFRFKKSVFFYDDIIVSLGSDIEYSAPAGRTDEVHTALFQDKMRTTAAPWTNHVISNAYRCNDATTMQEKTSWGGISQVVLVDVHGNRYVKTVKNDSDSNITRENLRELVKQ